jgi:hypothetical protein
MRFPIAILFLLLPALGGAASNPSAPIPDDQFLENKTPFLRSALVFEVGKTPNRTRRGVILPLGHRLWACFDPDLLRWAAIWRAPSGEAPITYDSMAAISFPAAKAKAKKPPGMRGTLLHHTPELPGASTGSQPGPDPRQTFLTDNKTPVGPLPREAGQWLGISLRGQTPVLHYRVGTTTISETIRATSEGTIQRCLQIGPNKGNLTFRLGSPGFQTGAKGATIRKNILHLAPSQQTREVLLSNSPATDQTKLQVPPPQAATPLFPETQTATHPPAQPDGPFSVRNIPLPANGRPIRPTDLAFLSDGTALLCTLDGDIWRVEGLDGSKSTWMRVATGLFEPMSITITEDDRVFVLGRDQVTELVDTNEDGHVDLFRCSTDAFLQTLHTRDYATSLERAPDGSFLIAKGGIHKYGNGAYDEISGHRGTILRISPDGATSKVLADGLRLPYVGLSNDGSVFASDQQGRFVPSTPIHRLGDERPFLGFAPSNFRATKQAVEPLLYYPYQSNRSAAAFTTTSEQAFSDLANTFLQVSWNGRLFGIATPETGQAFSWQLPVQFDFPTLNGATHPQSGRLYAIGLGISGYKPSTPKLLGLASIEQTRPIPTPAAIKILSDAIEVSFRRPLAPNETVIPGSPALRVFNIQRSSKYGSGHFQWDGKPGEHHFQPSTFALSPDRRTLRLSFEQIRQSDVLDLQLVVSSGELTAPLHLFTRPTHLEAASPADLAALARRAKEVPELLPGNPVKGNPLFTQYACSGCHSLAEVKLTGPPLKGIASRLNEDGIRASILDPTATITEGYPPSMPSFAGVIPPQELEDLLAYLLTLDH